MTVSEIISELISETGGDTDDSSLQSLWLGFLKAAIRKFPEFCRTRTLSATSSATLSTGSRLIAKPTGFEYPKTAYRLYDTQRIPITFVPDETFNLYYRSEAGAPQFCRINGDNIETDVPGDQDYTIGLDYWKDISTIVVGDTLARRFIEPAKEWAKFVYYMDYEEDTTGKASAHFALGNDLLDRIEMNDMEQEIGTHVSDE